MRPVYAALFLALGAFPAVAQRVPAIVIPGKPGVPVIINGVDVSGAVIEGDFGLDRPRGVTPTVIFPPFAAPVAYNAGYDERGYFPAAGRRPGYGRLEIVPPPNRPLPRPAPSFYRRWSSDSASGPVTIEPPSYDLPDVVVAPTWRRHRGPRAHHSQTGAGRP